jgi:hypothetical protein
MINIIKGSINVCVFTLNEKTTFTDAKYLLELYSNDDRGTKVLKLGTELSSDIIRFNQFNIEESDTEDLINAVISLNVGTYDYKVYETESDLITLVDANVVETGKLVVTGEETESTTYDNNTNEYTFT